MEAAVIKALMLVSRRDDTRREAFGQHVRDEHASFVTRRPRVRWANNCIGWPSREQMSRPECRSGGPTRDNYLVGRVLQHAPGAPNPNPDY